MYDSNDLRKRQSIYATLFCSRDMPCACQATMPEYPEVEHWGPLLWMILHALAERGGTAVSPLFYPDEKRHWILVINNLPSIIPCPDCREHATLWVAAHPSTAIKDVPVAGLHEWLTSYMYSFHEAVNVRIGKPSFDRRRLAETYAHVRIGAALRALTPFIETAIQLSGLRILGWNKWLGYAQMLMSVYGV